ncbi:MAG TPA: rhodanese-like domain-containing protein, partial [bacterium]|nr:rhodanese-like domain-containing protein [bacterium]
MLNWLKQLFGFSKPSVPPARPAASVPQYDSHEVSPQEVKKKLDDGAPIILLDVREDQELRIAAIPQALHIPMGEIHARYKEISDDPAAEIIVFCHHGARGEVVMHQLWGLGYQNAKIMPG